VPGGGLVAVPATDDSRAAVLAVLGVTAGAAVVLGLVLPTLRPPWLIVAGSGLQMRKRRPVRGLSRLRMTWMLSASSWPMLTTVLSAILARESSMRACW
jgi:hypothetical protein